MVREEGKAAVDGGGDEMPPHVRAALVEILADALVASYLRDHGATDTAVLRYNRRYRQ